MGYRTSNGRSAGVSSCTIALVITIDQVIGISLASVVLLVVPGPSVMFVIGRALSYGRSNAIASIIGNSVGCYTVGVLIAVGLGPVLERSEIIFLLVKWVGVCYLIFLGVQAICSAGTLAADQLDGASASRGSLWSAIRAGFVVGLTNPKVLVLFTAIVPQFVNPMAGGTTLQLLLVGLVPILVGLITDAGWALLAGRARTWLADSPSRITVLGRLGGLCILGVGVSVAISGNR